MHLRPKGVILRRKRTEDRAAWQYRVYKYGATLHERSTPTRWPDPLRQVVEAQQALWNACVAAWEQNRADYEALMAQAAHLDPLRDARDTARTAVDTLVAQGKQQRQQTRQRHYPGWEADAQALEAARHALRQATTGLRHAEAAYRVHLKPQLTALLETLWQAVHDLGQASPLAWYNERLITDSFRNAVERFLKRVPHAGPPKPRRHRDQVHLTYHFTGPPLTWEQLLLGKSSMITFGDQREVLPVDPWVWDETQPQNPRRRASRTTGHLRISDADTLDFGVTLQRRPPEGALVKGVELVGRARQRPWMEHRTPLWRWELLVLCEVPPRGLVPAGDLAPPEGDLAALARDPVPAGDLAPTTAVPAGDTAPLMKRRAPVSGGGLAPAEIFSSAAIDLNWRILDDDRIRVGMVYDGRTSTPLYFPAALVKRWRFAQDLQQEVAAALERCKADLTRLWQETPLPPDADPRGAGWAQTGQSGLLRFLRTVEAFPPAVPSRQATLEVLRRWAHRTGRLWREWRGLVGRLDRARTAWQATAAKQLCTQYQAIAIERLDVKQMAEAADQAPRLQRSQQYRQLVGLGAFLTRLAHTAQREGCRLVPVDPAGTTSTCARCGAPVVQTGEIFLTCAQGHHVDTDVNAAQIIHARAFAAPEA